MKPVNAFDYFFEHSHKLEKDFVLGRESISFQQLHNEAISLAGWIQDKIGQEKHIIIMAPNSVFFIRAYLAVIKSGNVAIPLDPSFEKENLHYIASVSSPEMAFLDLPATNNPELEINYLITPENVPVNHSSTLKPINGQNQTAEILFTSGSTGKPKGVMLSHKNLIANTSSITAYLELSEQDRMLVVLPFFYCYGLSLLHTHLRAGGSVVLNNSFMFLGHIIKQLNEYSCTGFAGVPSHFQILLRKSKSFRESVFPELRYVTQAGGHLSTVIIDEFREIFPEKKFYVMYGQTEATARLAYLPPNEYVKRKGSIGKAIPGVELRIVNKQGKDVQSGEVGEIIARGDNIMKGYFQDPEGSAEVLKNNWLYTGDLAEVDEDGYIFLTARKKEIIKSGGKRISPKEIENVILEIPRVVECMVEGVADEVQGEAIVATVYINPSHEVQLKAEDLKRFCEGKLAPYKIPVSWIIRDKIALTSTGKKRKENRL